MKLISVTMKLFFWEKFQSDLKGWKMGRLESLRFDFCMFIFDTMKRISFAKVSKTLAPNGFWQKGKERKYRINTCVPIWSGRGDLNTRPFGPEPNALPSCATPRLMEPMKGLEPLTCALRMRCSASWATLAYTSKDYSIVFWVCHHCRVNIFWDRDLKTTPQPL